MKGIVTDIQRFSLKDGPGIRTTVFVKGCNMACKWCHNPETISLKPQILRYPEHCVRCGSCVETCKYGACTVSEHGIAYNRALCVSCGACANECFTGALVMSGKEMSAGEVMAEVMQDADYYRNSGGGVTISGGEPACQPDFVHSLVKTLHNAGVSAAIETNMLADWGFYEDILPFLDLVMLDIKLFDDNAHRQWTGAGNRQILINTEKIARCKSVIIRTPIIPGVNDNAGEITDIARFISTLNTANVRYYELLLFNPLGEGKYGALGLNNPFAGVKPSNDEKAAELAKAAAICGVEVRIN